VTGEPRPIICVFAKPPRPGLVKTRLASGVGDVGAATLARAFLNDIWTSLQQLGWARVVLATTDCCAAGWDLAPLVDRDIWPQGDGDLGERLQRVFRRALAEAPLAFAVGSDSPGLPPTRLDHARCALAHADAVLGPCEDGGFYLLGLRRCPEGLLEQLPWSSQDTFHRTRERLERAGLAPVLLPPWFDIDEMPDLDRLKALLRTGRLFAPATARELARIASLPP
jgi:rSAM/selenodomain-associated transferase 1